MKRLSFVLGIATALAVSLANTSHAGESIFQEGVNGYTGTLDTEIVGGQPDAEGSNTTTLNPDGADRGGEVQVLIRFDNIFGTEPNQIPPGQSVFFASLTLNISGPGSDQNLHRMLVPWEETATWNDISDPFDLMGPLRMILLRQSSRMLCLPRLPSLQRLNYHRAPYNPGWTERRKTMAGQCSPPEVMELISLPPRQRFPLPAPYLR